MPMKYIWGGRQSYRFTNIYKSINNFGVRWRWEVNAILRLVYLQKTATVLIAEKTGIEWYGEDKISCPYMSTNPGLSSM